MIPYMSLEEQVDSDFIRARRRALLRRVGARFHKDPTHNRLLSFDEVREASLTDDRTYLGTKIVEAEKIVGSVGRQSDFDRSFLPARVSVKARWKRVDRAFHRIKDLPPVSLYKIGDTYFVVDGNHRVSVARYHGVPTVEAVVTEFLPRTPSVPPASAEIVNLTYSAEEVGGAVMPPGMVMSRDTPADAMREMAAIDPSEVSYAAPADARGDQPLEPAIEDGVKVFDLDVSVIEWNILPDEQVEAYAFNRQVPGPRLRVTEGDKVRINVTNNLPEPTSVHWHGMILPNRMDGAAGVTRDPIEPGETFAYEFAAGQAGTYFYHSHKEPDRQQGLGMYGALIVDPEDPTRDAAYGYDREVVVQLQEWQERDGYTYPAMTMEGAFPNYFTINGKSYPETETVEMELGERLRIRFVGSNNNFVHPMHVHGGPFEIVETDGNPVPEQVRILKDTVNVGPGERYDVIWEARKPGKWLLHCHIPHHTTNDNTEQEGGGGLMALINVTE